MGLPIPLMRMILREHKIKPFRGEILTIGRLGVLASYQQVLEVFNEEGISPAKLDEGHDLTTNIPSWKEGKYADFTSDIVFF